MRPEDTSPEAWRVYIDLLRKMPPSERLYRAMELSDLIRYACEAGVRRAYPAADEREVFLRAAQRRLGAELFRRVYDEPFRTDEPRDSR